MEASELRAKAWRLRTLMENSGGGVTPTVDRQLALAQLEVQIELTCQIAEMNQTIKRIGIINFEEFALRLEDWFKKQD